MSKRTGIPVCFENLLPAPGPGPLVLRWHHSGLAYFVGRLEGNSSKAALITLWVYREGVGETWSARLTDAHGRDFGGKIDSFDEPEAAKGWCVQQATELLQAALAALTAGLADGRIPAAPAL